MKLKVFRGVCLLGLLGLLLLSSVVVAYAGEGGGVAKPNDNSGLLLILGGLVGLIVLAGVGLIISRRK